MRGPISFFVEKLPLVLMDLHGDRLIGALSRTEHVLWPMPITLLKEIEVVTALGGQVLDLDAELLAEALQGFVIAVNQFAAELAEHALVKIRPGEHPSTPAVAGFEQHGFCAVLF